MEIKTIKDYEKLQLQTNQLKSIEEFNQKCKKIKSVKNNKYINIQLKNGINININEENENKNEENDEYEVFLN